MASRPGSVCILIKSDHRNTSATFGIPSLDFDWDESQGNESIRYAKGILTDEFERTCKSPCCQFVAPGKVRPSNCQSEANTDNVSSFLGWRISFYSSNWLIRSWFGWDWDIKARSNSGLKSNSPHHSLLSNFFLRSSCQPRLPHSSTIPYTCRWMAGKSLGQCTLDDFVTKVTSAGFC